MDWRAMSRSRSRISMDWSPARRSRSRPPGHGITFDQHGLESRIPFPTLESEEGGGFSVGDTLKYDDTHCKPPSTVPSHTRGTASIPIPRASSQSRPSPTSFIPQHPAIDDQVDHSFNPSSHLRYTSDPDAHLLSSFHSAGFTPSSFPSYGLNSLSMSRPPPPEQRTFPKHVRKTSFDHTVTKDDFFPGVSGRHQVNGKPLSPDSVIGLKRRADAPHAESLLRGDPASVAGQRAGAHISSSHDTDQLGSDSPYSASTFNFSFPSYDVYNLPGNTGAPPDYSLILPQTDDHHAESPYPRSPVSSVAGASYSSTVGSPPHGNEGLSAAAAAASQVMAEGYAQLRAAGLEEPGLNYGPLMA